MKTKIQNRLPEINGSPEIAKKQTLQITPPKIEVLELKIRGTTPLVMNRFSFKAQEQIKAKHIAGSQANKGKKREPKDFQECYEQSKHVSTEGWIGIPAGAFRNAMIDACRLIGFRMTLAKQAVFIKEDGFDKVDATPLVRITKGEPHYLESVVRNETGVVDLRARACWDPGWEALIRVRYDADLFQPGDIANLLARVGAQVGILEGRPFSKNSAGQGWGCFEIIND